MDFKTPDNLSTEPIDDQGSVAQTVSDAPERPAWFKKRTDPDPSDEIHHGEDVESIEVQPEQQKSRRVRKKKKSFFPKITKTEEPAEELTWKQKARRWIISIAAGSYGLSLLVHVTGLGALSIFYIAAEMSDGALITELTASEEADLEVEDVHDTAMDVQQSESSANILQQLQKTQAESEQFVPKDINTGFAQSDGDGDSLADGFANSFKFRMPTNGKAIIKGSFAAWTVPEDPQVGEDYRIVIQVKVPKTLKRYRVSDLSGQVVGTDGFRHTIPWDRTRPSAAKTERSGKLSVINARSYLPSKGGVAQLIIEIPGAGKLVEDTIEIRSRALKENQKLKIVF
ncbi:MAG: hypothetical protein CMJ78_05375 [Planctomycetaceae bacterium]|nr:hypothetical protein [Planctomycetaceae bacterium]